MFVGRHICFTYLCVGQNGIDVVVGHGDDDELEIL